MPPIPSASPSPLDTFNDHDKVFAPAFCILQEAIANRAFPAVSVAVTHKAHMVALKSLGHLTYEDDATINAENMGTPLLASLAKSGKFDATPSTLFDLASLTKIVPTTPMAMILYERGLLDLDAPVSAIVPEFLFDAPKD